jgi:hypothetical protein
MNGLRKRGLYTQQSITQPQRGIKLCCLRQIDGTGAERQRPHVFFHVWKIHPERQM